MSAAPLTPDTLRTIRRNAGRVAPAEIAKALGWSISQLERVAREQRIDLRIEAEVPSAREQLEALARPRDLNSEVRSEHLTISLLPVDLQAIETIARDRGIKRARVVTRIIENARARDLLAELATLPAPMPEPTGNLE